MVIDIPNRQSKGADFQPVNGVSCTYDNCENPAFYTIPFIGMGPVVIKRGNKIFEEGIRAYSITFGKFACDHPDHILNQLDSYGPEFTSENSLSLNYNPLHDALVRVPLLITFRQLSGKTREGVFRIPRYARDGPNSLSVYKTVREHLLDCAGLKGKRNLEELVAQLNQRDLEGYPLIFTRSSKLPTKQVTLF